MTHFISLLPHPPKLALFSFKALIRLFFQGDVSVSLFLIIVT